MVACCAVQHLPQGTTLCQLSHSGQISVREDTMATFDKLDQPKQHDVDAVVDVGTSTAEWVAHQDRHAAA